MIYLVEAKWCDPYFNIVYNLDLGVKVGMLE